jgi:hypothetical protein
LTSILDFDFASSTSSIAVEFRQAKSSRGY